MKFSGTIGFWYGVYEETPGCFTNDKIIERHYTGDVLQNSQRFQNASESLNDEIHINNRISILADLYAKKNYHTIRYVRWNEVNWKVTSVTPSYPKIILELGEVYNGRTLEQIEGVLD